MKETLRNKRKVQFYLSKYMEKSLVTEMKTPYKKDESLKIETYNNAVIYPLINLNKSDSLKMSGGITDEFGNMIGSSLTKRVSPPNFEMNFNNWYDLDQNFMKKQKKISENEVIFIGALPKHYGHFITEGISRIWYFLEQNSKQNNLVYISEDGEDNFLELFEIFGIPLSRVKKITEPTQFSKIIIPEPSIRLHDYYHLKYKNTVSRIIKNVPHTNRNKLYLSKKQRFNGRAIGEKFIENYFAKNGFEIIYPEDLDLRSFISKLKSCEVAVSTSGTSAHNAIFLEEFSHFICLNRSRHHHPLQIMIDEMRNLNVVYIEACLNIFKTNFSSGPFNLFPTKYLINYIKDNQLVKINFFEYSLSILSTIYYVFYKLFLGKLIHILAKWKNSFKND